jgi:hypothetical protein
MCCDEIINSLFNGSVLIFINVVALVWRRGDHPPPSSVECLSDRYGGQGILVFFHEKRE